MNVQHLFAHRFAPTNASYRFKDTILYALGVGFGTEPLDEDHLRFLYESELRAVPTFCNVLGHPGFWGRDPQFEVDWRKLLHAEHRLTIHRPLAAEGDLRAEHDIIGIRDRGAEAGAFVHQRKRLIDEASGEAVASVVTTLLLRGDGGCGDHGDAPPELDKLPRRDPDQKFEVTAPEILPLIYRLSGDFNPLHIDPEVARAAGFERPILHGLATMGIAAYSLLRCFCDFNPGRLHTMAVRFSRPVLPGDTLAFEFWTENDLVRFRASALERAVVVLDRGSAAISELESSALDQPKS